jgi:hypothetical protein
MESDFDFIFGDWIVKHQRLKERLKGSRDWEEFDGRCRATPLLGGHGNVDDNFVNIPGGAYRAISLRSFDAVQHLMYPLSVGSKMALACSLLMISSKALPFA